MKIFNTTIKSLPVLALLTLASCNDYLDTIPSKGNNEMLTSSEQVEALFNNNSMFIQSVSVPVASSDDMGMDNNMYDSLGYMDQDFVNGLTFAVNDIETNQYGDALWEGAYNKIFTANLIINEIDQVKDATETQKTNFLAQAHFIRALAMWELAQTYCQPYSSTTLSAPGLPLRTGNDYQENVTRASLKDTYDFILNDLKAALTTSTEDVGDRWLVSKPAVEAMMARYYLFTQDYAQAEAYAKKAMKSKNVTLEDYNGYSLEPATVMDPNTSEESSIEYSQLWSYSPNEVTNYAENYFSAYFDVSNGIYLIPSESLISLYDQDNDLRFEQFFNKHALWNNSISGFGDDLQYHRMQNSYGDDLLTMGPTLPEMILTAAEAEARQGKVAEAMATVNTLRRARIRNSASDIELSANSQEEAVKKILDERHREMPFISRWQDIRRLAYNEVSYDDVTVTHTFYKVVNNVVDNSEVLTYTLPVKSARYAQPITNLEIRRSKGQISQNEYSDNDVVKTVQENNNSEEDNSSEDNDSNNDNDSDNNNE